MLLNYTLPPWWENLLDAARYIVVADGGARAFLKFVEQRRYLQKTTFIGDMDSVDQSTMGAL